MGFKPSDKDIKMCEWINSKFKQAYVSKAPLMEQWKKYERAYNGDLFRDVSRPEYKSNQVTNHIFATIESIRPIMTDNNPKFIAEPTTPDGDKFSADVQVALDYEFNREKMDLKLSDQLIPYLVYGTCVWFMPWDARDGEGQIKCKPVNPFNIFPDPLAEDVDSAEYIIYATYKHANQLKKLFPDKADAFVGSSINHSELVAERDKYAIGSNEQILTLEMWFRDWTTMEEVEDESGNKKKKQKYPNGRVITACPDIGVVLADKPNPYKDGKFPFLIMKDYTKPFEFWGRGEVEQILSPQMYMNELTNQIIDNAKNTANMPWIIDKNCGITPGKLTNRPGQVIRKNPGTEVTRPTPPSMPVYVRDTIETMKKDVQDISGVFDSLKGEKQSGVVAAQAIMALQEASQARIRLKIKNMEHYLGDLATMWYSRMQQYWKFNRWVKVTDIENNIDFREITPEILKNNFDIRISAGSTMPTNKNAMLDLMIRLAQTTAEDGMPMVDRRSVVEFLPNVDKKRILTFFEEKANQAQAQQEQQAQMQQQIQQAQQIGEQDKQNIIETLQSMQEALKTVNQQVDQLVSDKELENQKKQEDELKAKEYERGVNDGMQKGQEEEEEIMPGEEPQGEDEETIKLLEAIGSGELPLDVPGEGEEGEQPPMSEEEMYAMAENDAPGELPVEVLQEIASMSEEELMALLEEYPELLEMLQADTQAIGGALGDSGQGMQ